MQPRRLERRIAPLLLLLAAAAACPGADRGRSDTAMRTGAAVARNELAGAPAYPDSFANDSALTSYVDGLMPGARFKRFTRKCKPNCPTIDVEIAAMPLASTVDYKTLVVKRLVAIVRTVDAKPGQSSDDRYELSADDALSLIVVERGPATSATDSMVWRKHALRRVASGSYQVVDGPSIYGYFTPCDPHHKPKGDDAAFQSCDRAHMINTSSASPTVAGLRLSSLSIVWGMRFQGDTTKFPTDPLWVSCAYGCCTASGT